MLLTITNTRYPADDLSYLMHKHPAKVQETEFSQGIAHIFYPEVSPQKCTIALLLDIDPISLVRKNGPAGNDFALQQYVNDRPYAASSFLSGALAKAFSSALNGRCKDKPEMVSVPLDLEVNIPVLPVRGGENVLRGLFEPLGYTVQCTQHPLDGQFPEWGNSRYFSLKLTHTLTLQALLQHLYILIPVCDNDKHYFVGKEEVEKLMEKGRDWLETHPQKELIILRFLKHQKGLANQALEQILQEEEPAAETEETTTPSPVRVRMHDVRLQAVKDELLATGAATVADLGCGEGKLLRLLMNEKQFTGILGMDISYHSLTIAKDKLKLERLPEKQQQRIQLIQGSLTYRDERLHGYDAAALVEVIEHLDEPRLATLEKVVFGHAKPRTVIVTTPNAEYNIKFESLEAGTMRHNDHRFEWTRAQFSEWAGQVAQEHGYTVSFKPLGEEDPEVGALSQMGIFSKTTD
ncbi:3' terminal RNA ribose 2'-O-methyltransferase Hen1 [Chitinophaga barathri]|uniref:Small RNA 2'-O-methyltransferase n=1 Tax=Chitinophaga barathri TaxID=1647451 RepID=A0A3N4M9Z0_9BACT|nr:3' terminal RNA ribose 2'-O-methyltransferase Hen1 [Chitinophaga barathri]RPD40564.1 3' terminal RNA ribose 2'-O-methyltransferase Hen1 [Chitinophaga barathri]